MIKKLRLKFVIINMSIVVILLGVILANAEFLQNPSYDENEKSRFSQNVLTMAHKMR